MNKADALKTAAFLARSIDLHKRLNNLIGALEPKNGRIYYTEQAVAHIRELAARVDEQDALLQQAVEAMKKVNGFVWHYANSKDTARKAEAHDAAIAAIEKHRKKHP